MEFWSRSGAKTSDLFSYQIDIIYNQPQVVFLQIGGNDFTGSANQDHMDVAYDIIRLARRVRTHSSVHAVYIGKLFYRDFHAKYLPSPRHVDRYNDKVVVVNEFLQRAARTLANNHIYIWNCKGRESLRDSILMQDGTHLNDTGTKKYARSIRGSLVNSKSILSGNLNNTIYFPSSSCQPTIIG